MRGKIQIADLWRKAIEAGDGNIAFSGQLMRASRQLPVVLRGCPTDITLYDEEGSDDCIVMVVQPPEGSPYILVPENQAIAAACRLRDGEYTAEAVVFPPEDPEGVYCLYVFICSGVPRLDLLEGMLAAGHAEESPFGRDDDLVIFSRLFRLQASVGGVA